MRLCNRSHRIEDLPGPLFVHDRKVELRAARAFRLLIRSSELTGEQAASKRAPDQKTNLFSFQKRKQFALEVATGDGVVGMERIEAGEILDLGDDKRPAEPPRLPVSAAVAPV